MALRNDHYTYRVTWSENDKEYVGLCAEFPSLSWLAKTPESALKGIRNIVADIVNDMKSNEVISHIGRDNKAGPKIAFMLSRYKSYLKRTDTTDSGPSVRH